MIRPQPRRTPVVRRKNPHHLHVRIDHLPRLLRSRKYDPAHLGKLSPRLPHEFMKQRRQPRAAVRIFTKNGERESHHSAVTQMHACRHREIPFYSSRKAATPSLP